MLVEVISYGIVRDGVDGVVLPPYEVEAWVEALRKFSNSPDLRARLGDSARERVKDFTWERVARRRAELVLEKMKVSGSDRAKKS